MKLEVEIKSYNCCLQIIFGSSSCLLASKLVFFFFFFFPFILSFLSSFLPCLAFPCTTDLHERWLGNQHRCKPFTPPSSSPPANLSPTTMAPTSRPHFLLLSSFIHPSTSIKPPFHPSSTDNQLIDASHLSSIHQPV